MPTSRNGSKISSYEVLIDGNALNFTWTLDMPMRRKEGLLGFSANYRISSWKEFNWPFPVWIPTWKWFWDCSYFRFTQSACSFTIWAELSIMIMKLKETSMKFKLCGCPILHKIMNRRQTNDSTQKKCAFIEMLVQSLENFHIYNEN